MRWPGVVLAETCRHAALTAHRFDWLAVFSYHNLRLLRAMVG